MKRAILHIGTEKTGTTSIQKFLYENRIKLGAKGFLFPESAGYISNQNLVVYGKKAPEADLAPRSLDVSNATELTEWKDRFVQTHCSEILAFQQRHDHSTVIYSAEHLQSRLTTVGEIKRVARLLRPLFDEVEELVYLRRQDRYALSAYSTAVRGGQQRGFSFETINAQGPYYDYRTLLENWSEVFGESAVRVRLFEKPRLVGSDVVSDFKSVVGINELPIEFVTPESVNEALSYTALSLLRRFNALDSNDPRLLGRAKSATRIRLLEAVQGIQDQHGRMMPPQSQAASFYQRFKEGNQWVANRWLDGIGFDDNFSEYPEHAAESPELPDLELQLDELIAGLFKRKRISSVVRAVTATDKTSRHVTERVSEKTPETVEPEMKPVPHKGYARRLGAALKERLLKAS